MKSRFWVAVFVFTFVFCVSLIVSAPASVLSAQLVDASGGRLSLANTRGTIWSGSGILLFQHDMQYISMGDYAWQFRPAALLGRGLEFEVRQGADASPMRVRYDVLKQTAELSQWHTTLPAQILGMLAPQLRPYQLNGQIRLTTDSLTVSQNGTQGHATVDWLQAGSGLTDVHPLGDYRIRLEGAGQRLSVQLSTLSGKLLLAGSGQVEPGRGLNFNGTAQAAEGDQQEALAELLHHVGPETAPGVFRLGLISQ